MSISNSSNFPELRTVRFLLRRIVASDLPAVYAGLSDPLVIAHYGVSYDSLEATREQMEWFESIYANGTGVWWGICDPANPSVLLGACGLNDLVRQHRRAELGYWLFPMHWGKAIASECLSALLAYALGPLALHRIGAEVDLDNDRSCRLLERLGFTLEGIRRAYEHKNGKPLDLKLYSRLACDPSPRI